MNDDQYLSVLNSFEADAVQYNTNFNTDNEELQRRYKGELYGDEKPERSKVVSNDVQDTVESDMPSLARNFLGARKPCIFEPNTLDPEEIDEAKEKTEYVDWIVRKQVDSFRTQHGFLKDIEVQNMGALKYFMEDIVEKRVIPYEDISFEELTRIEAELSEDERDTVEITERSDVRTEGEEERLDVKFEVTRKVRKVKVIGIPLESLLISTNASSEEDANLVGDTVRKTRGELLQEGFDIELISKLPTAPNKKGDKSSLPDIRFDKDTGIDQDSFNAWATQNVDISDLYVKIDKDGDGVAERRHIIKSGNEILSDDPFEIVPYAITSAILMSHTIKGISRAELAAPIAKIKTAIIRGMQNNAYAVNEPMLGVNEDVNMDDLLVRRPNGLVRTEGNTNPGNSIFPMNIDYIGDKALQVVNYWDQAKAQTIGTIIASQGLQADAFKEETATRFQGMKDASQAKIELVVRVIAETAYCRMYAGIAWLVSQYQTTEVEIKVLGKPLTVNPSNWKHKHQPTSTLGLGSGDGERTTETLSSIYGLQTQLKVEGSVLVDEVKRYNTLDSLLKSLDIHNTSEFFNNPERPDELITAQNELLTQAVQQLQQMVEQLQNPLAEAEEIKANASLITAQGKAQLEVAKLMEQIRQFDVTTAQDSVQFDKTLSKDLTKIEADTGENVPGSVI